MRENRFFIRSGDLESLSPIRIAGRAVFLAYGDLIDRLERLVGTAAASLFAEPVLPRGASGEAGTISWYTSHEGAVLELVDIDEVTRKPIVEKLRSRLEALGPALADPDIGPYLSNWLSVSDLHDILSIGGEPVLVNWGLLPRSVTSDAQRAEHFSNTVGRFVPGSTPTIGGPPQAEPAANPTSSQDLRAEPGVPASRSPDRGTPPHSPADAQPVVVSANLPGEAAAEPILTVRSESDRRTRPWLAPLVACALAAIVLLILAVPGVLVYPVARADNPAGDRFELDRLKASNDSLESQLDALDRAAGDKICRPVNFVVPVPGIRPGPGAGDAAATPPRLQVEPKPPEQAPLPPPPSGQRDGPATAGALLEKTTVLIVGFGAEQGDDISYSQGTGFLIDDRHVVTNHHVVQTVQPNRIFVANKAIGGVRQAKIVALSEPPPTESDIRVDLAVLEIEPVAGMAGLPLGPSPPKLATAYVAGFPGFLTERDVKFQSFLRTLAHGVFNREDAERALAQQNIDVPSVDLEAGRINNSMASGSGAVPILLHDMQLAKGNSGGPVIDACGRLIGINTALFASDAGTRQGNVAQDVSTLRKFLADKQIGFRGEDAACAVEATASASPTPVATPSPAPSPQPTAAPTTNRP